MNEPSVRILHITNRLNIGGPTIYVTLLIAGFKARGYDARLICSGDGRDENTMRYYLDEHDITPIEVRELGGIITPIRDVRALWRLYRLIREIEPDVVHTHTTKGGFIGRTAAYMARVPVIVHTLHSHLFHGYFGAPMTWILILMERLAARMSDAVLTLTEGLRQELAETYHITRRGRIMVLPLGLDLDRFANTRRKNGTFRAEWHIPADAPLIGIIGRLEPIKNHALFMEAAAHIRRDLPDAHFIIIGDGILRETLEHQADALGLRDAVTFTGWQQNLPAIYSDLDVSVVSSINEGMPVSVIESLAAGCPVVATAVGGVPDLLNGGALGTLVPPQDAPALADAITTTIRTPPDVTPAQQTILASYGKDRLIDDMDSLYRGLLAKKQR